MKNIILPNKIPNDNPNKLNTFVLNSLIINSNIHKLTINIIQLFQEKISKLFIYYTQVTVIKNEFFFFFGFGSNVYFILCKIQT